jgi:hypothetical protein
MNPRSKAVCDRRVLQEQIEYNKMMTIWRLLITSPARGAWNMAVDESILEHAQAGRGESILM